jgi:threonine dehydrogenase-like Zn-dependent dehydrogenase
MKALKYVAKSQFEMVDIEEPADQENHILIRVDAAGICGSEINGFKGNSSRHTPPLILGHEMVGTVEGPSNSNFSRGEKVVINPLVTCGACDQCESGRENICINRKLIGIDAPGGFAEKVAIPEQQVYRLSKSIDIKTGLLIEPLANIVHLFRKIDLTNTKEMKVIGAGVQGILAMLYAKKKGIQFCRVSDINAERLKLVKALGADSIINPSDGSGAIPLSDASIDAVGSTVSRVSALDSVKNGGTVFFFGMHEKFSKLDCYSIVAREISVRGSVLYTQKDFQEAVDIINKGEIDGSSLLTEFPIEEGQRIFERLAKNPGGIIKAILLH